MTRLGFINIFILQWFFIRLARNQERIIDKFEPTSYSIGPNGGMEGKITASRTITWYSIMWCIVPLTGWWSDYIYLTKKAKHLRITPKKAIQNQH